MSAWFLLWDSVLIFLVVLISAVDACYCFVYYSLTDSHRHDHRVTCYLDSHSVVSSPLLTLITAMYMECMHASRSVVFIIANALVTTPCLLHTTLLHTCTRPPVLSCLLDSTHDLAVCLAVCVHLSLSSMAKSTKLKTCARTTAVCGFDCARMVLEHPDAACLC